MSLSDTPTFWYEKAGPAAWLLWPFSLLYGAASGHAMRAKPDYAPSMPVVCVGNFVAGGAGKTPTAIALAARASALGHKPGFLSRGYGGAHKGPHLVNPKTDTAHDVGDEALLLAAHAPAVVSSDRIAGAKALEKAGVDLIIMDDGFQNPKLHKDATVAVVDATRAVGNGMVHPAGPLRAPLRVQLAQASALLVIGKSQGGVAVVRQAARMAKPVLTGDLDVPDAQQWAGKRVLAYCGLGDPEKFFRSLQHVGADIAESRTFPDHHPYTADDCKTLLADAEKLGATPVTTQKDHVRLNRRGETQQRLHDQSQVLPVTLTFENPRSADRLLQDAVQACRTRTAGRRF